MSPCLHLPQQSVGVDWLGAVVLARPGCAKKSHDMHPAVLHSRFCHEKSLGASATRCNGFAKPPLLAPEWLAQLPSSLRRMPRVRTDPVPSCSGCDPAVERGHTTLPTEDAPIAHYRATQCAVCRMVVSLQNLTFHARCSRTGTSTSTSGFLSRPYPVSGTIFITCPLVW